MTIHAINRAYERYKLQLNEFDMVMIYLLIKLGLAKRIDRPPNIFGKESNGILYHLRYGGKLIAPILVQDKIVTFEPCGKKISWKKYLKKKQSKSYIQMMKRLERN